MAVFNCISYVSETNRKEEVEPATIAAMVLVDHTSVPEEKMCPLHRKIFNVVKDSIPKEYDSRVVMEDNDVLAFRIFAFSSDRDPDFFIDMVEKVCEKILSFLDDSVRVTYATSLLDYSGYFGPQIDNEDLSLWCHDSLAWMVQEFHFKQGCRVKLNNLLKIAQCCRPTDSCWSLSNLARDSAERILEN